MAEVLPIVIYVLLIILITVAIIIGIKLIFTLQKVDALVDDVTDKVKTLDRVFELVDTVNDKIAIVGDTVIGLVSGGIRRLFKIRKQNKKKKIEAWIIKNQLTDKIFSESGLMDLVKCFFMETHTIRKCKDDFSAICNLWIEGKTPFEINTITDNDMNDIDDVCSKQISYELSFFIGNIRDLLADNTGLFKEELEEQLSIIQKKVKYGVPSLTALSICEKVFNDRLLAVKISDVLEDDDISEDEIITSLQQRKENIEELLNDYPEFFWNRIISVLY